MNMRNLFLISFFETFLNVRNTMTEKKKLNTQHRQQKKRPVKRMKFFS